MHTNPSSIDQLYNELIEAEPSLAQHEQDVKSLIDQFLSLRPDAEADETFKHNLRTHIMKKMTPPADETRPSYFGPLWGFVGGAAIMGVAAYVALPHMYEHDGSLPGEMMPRGGSKTLDEATAPTPKMASLPPEAEMMEGSGQSDTLANVAITENSKNAFGNIAVTNTNEEMVEQAVGRGGGGAMAVDMIMPYPEQSFKYVYAGDITLPQSAKVYRRTPLSMPVSQTLSDLQQVGMGVLNLAAFPDAVVENISIKTSGEDTYNVNISPQSGTVSLYRVEKGIIRPELSSYRPMQPLMEDDIPQESRIIEVADAFLAQMGIGKDGVGSPRIVKYWETYRSPGPVYIPDVMTVVYPFELEGKTTVDQQGNPTGYQVNVNIRDMKAQGGDFGLLNLESSEYGVASGEVIQEKIRQFGRWGGTPDFAPRTEVPLTNPRIELVQYWIHTAQGGTQYYVPAYIFDVDSDSVENYAGPSSITIPIIEEIQ